MSHDGLLRVNEVEYAEQVVAHFSIAPLELHRDRIEALRPPVEVEGYKDDYGVRLSVRETYYRFALPFSGLGRLLRYQSSHSSPSPLMVENVSNTEIQILIKSCSDSEKIKEGLLGVVNEIERHVNAQSGEIKRWRSQLAREVTSLLHTRKRKASLSEATLGEFGFPVRKRHDAPKEFAAPVKKIKLLASLAQKASSEPQPVVLEEEYEEILAVLRSMALMMERSPSAFEKISEENLRMFFLVVLNGMFEGAATGETFNFGGKTDILVRVGDRNVFIAECKFWDGPKSFDQAVNQLLSYLTWRDSKAAIILFVRDTAPGTVLKKIPGLLEEHENFVQRLVRKREDEFRARMKSERDQEVFLSLTVLVFHVPREGSAVGP